MKPLRKHLKGIALFLAVIFLVQSCVVYQKTPTTLDIAVLKSKPVKVVSNNYEILKFKRLEQNEGHIYGVAKRNSRTSKILSARIVENEIDRRYVRILLADEQVNKIYHKDISASTFRTILYCGGAVAVIVPTLALGLYLGGY